MRIGINLLGEPVQRAGTGRLASELLHAIGRIDDQNTYIVFCSRKSHPQYQSVLRKYTNFQIIGVPSGTRAFSRRLYEQTLLPIKVLQYQVEVLYSTNNISPVALGSKNVVSILDAARWRFTSSGLGLNEFFIKTLISITAKVSGKIVTISEFSRKELVDTIGANPGKISVIRMGVNLNKFKPANQNEIRNTVEKYLGECKSNYLMMHSSLQDRKNHLRLIRAFKKSEFPGKFLIIGKNSDQKEKIAAEINKLDLDKKIIMAGYVPDSELIALLSGCTFYVFPSLYEGAGLTPLEAMACGKAVLASDIPPIREYCDKNYYAVDPNKVESIAQGIKFLYTDDKLRRDFENRGRKFVEKYSWRKTAESLVEILMRN